MNPRTQRAKQIMSTPGYCSQIDHDRFRVRSQTDPSKFYIVSKSDKLVCSCPDHETRIADCKHIKIVLDVMRRNGGYRNNTFRIMERAKFNLCKFCDSGNITKKGFKKGFKIRVQQQVRQGSEIRVQGL